MPKPVAGSQIIQDTFEQITEQAQDVGKGLKDAVTGEQNETPDQGNGDSGVELQSGKTDPAKLAKQAQQQGLTPQQLLAKRQQEKALMRFHQEQIQQWAATHQQENQQKEARKKQETEDQEAKKQHEIQQLREEEAKAAVLSPPKKTKPGRGTAFVVQQAKKSSMAEMAKMPSN